MPLLQHIYALNVCFARDGKYRRNGNCYKSVFMKTSIVVNNEAQCFVLKLNQLSVLNPGDSQCEGITLLTGLSFLVSELAVLPIISIESFFLNYTLRVN